eukprot:2500090-Pyramimonas_sp.AAC.1
MRLATARRIGNSDQCPRLDKDEITDLEKCVAHGECANMCRSSKYCGIVSNAAVNQDRGGDRVDHSLQTTALGHPLKPRPQQSSEEAPPPGKVLQLLIHEMRQAIIHFPPQRTPRLGSPSPPPRWPRQRSVIQRLRPRHHNRHSESQQPRWLVDDCAVPAPAVTP